MLELGAHFWSKVNKTDNCWIWAAGLNTSGYGQFHLPGSGGRKMLAHRATYQVYVGPISVGGEIDHRCFVRACVNPAHLREVTHKQNQEHRQGARGDNRSSGILGVGWSSTMGKWRVRVQHDGELRFGGYYDDLDEAASAAIALRNELFTHNDADRAVA